MVYSFVLMEDEGVIITDFELKEDLVDSYNYNPDIHFDDLNVQKKVESLPIGTLLEVQKKIGSPITILSVKEVNEKTLSSAFKQK